MTDVPAWVPITFAIAIVLAPLGCKSNDPPPVPTAPVATAIAPAAPAAPSISPAIRAKLDDFVSWVAKTRTAPNKLKGKPECLGPTDYAPGVCANNYILPGGMDMYTVDYFGKEPTAVRLHADFPTPTINCEDVAPTVIVRQWRDANMRKAYCRLTGGVLSGMQLLVTNALTSNDFHNTNVFVFSPSYLEHDPPFRDVIMREGL